MRSLHSGEEFLTELKAGELLTLVDLLTGLRDVEKTPFVQIWDIKPKNPEAFQKAQMEFVNSLPDEFKDRFVGFGTYDINRPNGATHWALVSGADLDDHLSFVNNLQKNQTKKFMKYMEDRGEVELVHNFTFQNLRFIR